MAGQADQQRDPDRGPLSTPPARTRGLALLELVAVMDRLRSPGGCPWDAQQTHASLVPYLLEEAYEAAEAIESGDREHMTEELGDMLLQVVFHARVAQEDPQRPFDIDDVAHGIAAKLRRRHPHVFGDVEARTPEQVSANWEQIKAAERAAKAAAHGGAVDADPLRGIPSGMPPLARATQVVRRLDRAGMGAAVDAGCAADTPAARLLELVRDLVRAGLDPDAELRAAVRAVTAHCQGPTGTH